MSDVPDEGRLAVKNIREQEMMCLVYSFCL